MLLPALNGARRTAKQLSCASNMRQLGQTMMSYSGDYSGQFMSAYDDTIGFWDGPWGAKLYSYLNMTMTYNASTQSQLGAFNCPENTKQQWRCNTMSRDETYNSYACNGWNTVSQAWDGLALNCNVASWANPSLLYLILENDYYRVEAWYDDGTDCVPIQMSVGSRTARYYHSGYKMNILHGDMHISSMFPVRGRGGYLGGNPSADAYANGKVWYSR